MYMYIYMALDAYTCIQNMLVVLILIYGAVSHGKDMCDGCIRIVHYEILQVYLLRCLLIPDAVYHIDTATTPTHTETNTCACLYAQVIYIITHIQTHTHTQ
eukprot:GHVQ01008406.1.p2 GENE.GHVQ01008406.1~~GHVQ01008406.1.p2  ORF type:complete len:101 (+),score=11.30 GHVQ01008406.1:201-503(+)